MNTTTYELIEDSTVRISRDNGDFSDWHIAGAIWHQDLQDFEVEQVLKGEIVVKECADE